jgi:ATP-binding cassette subfamily C protein PrsD
MMSSRERGGIVLVVAHRPSALAAVDKILVLNEGRVQSFGSREDIIAQVVGPSRPVPVPDPVREPAARSVS